MRQEFSKRKFRLQAMALMVVYFAVMFVVWPYLQHARNPLWKVLISVSPTIPVTLVVLLMAKRVLHSDELEQRLHLVSLGVATALVGTGSMIAGFLAMGRVWTGDGSELFWVFPALCFAYGFTRLALKRRITGSWGFWDC